MRRITKTIVAVALLAGLFGTRPASAGANGELGMSGQVSNPSSICTLGTTHTISNFTWSGVVGDNQSHWVGQFTFTTPVFLTVSDTSCSGVINEVKVNGVWVAHPASFSGVSQLTGDRVSGTLYGYYTPFPGGHSFLLRSDGQSFMTVKINNGPVTPLTIAMDFSVDSSSGNLVGQCEQ